jgi:serine/threonine-protein kinase
VRSRGEQVTARDLLDEGVRRVDSELQREPELRGEMLDLLANLYRKLGALPEARTLAERSLALRTSLHGGESAPAARSEWTLGWVLSDQGEFPPSRHHLDHAITVLDRTEGADSLAAADAREALTEVIFGAEGPAAALPVIERRLVTYRRVLGERDPRTALASSDLGVVLDRLDRKPEAEAALRRAAAVLDAVLPADDPRAAYPHNNLARLLMMSGRAELAEPEVRRAIAIRTKSLGADHLDTLTSRAQLTQVLMLLGRLDEAEPNGRAVLAGFSGKDRFRTTQARMALGQVLLAQKRFAEALVLFDEALAERGMLAPDHVLMFTSRINRVKALIGLGRRAEARRELAAIIPALEAKGAEGAELLALSRELSAKLAA